jgi:hypothetical protein
MRAMLSPSAQPITAGIDGAGKHIMHHALSRTVTPTCGHAA